MALLFKLQKNWVVQNYFPIVEKLAKINCKENVKTF